MEVRFRHAIALGILGISLNPLLVLSAVESIGQEPAREKDSPKSVPKNSGSSRSSNGTVADPAKGDETPDTARKKAGDQPDPGVYRIGIEDDLLISVWKEPDLSTSVVVRPDGMITLPLLNDIQVVGLQTSELQALLTEKLKAYVNEPQVTVIVRGIKSRKVYVYGQVAKAGAYLIVGRTLSSCRSPSNGYFRYGEVAHERSSQLESNLPELNPAALLRVYSGSR